VNDGGTNADQSRIKNPVNSILLPTTVVGSYPQPDWLIDRQMLMGNTPPRVRMRELWRVAPDFLEQAQDDATLLAVRDQERAGIDIVSDGEMRRESYFNRFATALEGIDLDNPGTVVSRTGKSVFVPRVVGRIRRLHAVNVRDVQFLRASTDRQIKVTVPGPFTMTQLARNDHYTSDAELALDYARAVNAEIRDLFAAGADVVQIDEPYMQAHPEEAREYGVAALEAALEGAPGTTAVHICFGYGSMVKGKPAQYAFLPELAATSVAQVSVETAQPNLDCSVLEQLDSKTIILGVLDLSTHAIEPASVIAERIRRALRYVDPERVIVAPDCGMKYLPRDVAFAKLQAMTEAARLVREDLSTRLLGEDRSLAKSGVAPAVAGGALR
jgi:5-methyltetrahydropteroyltriglutamate--homocysteine methyltransferase